MWGKPSPTCLGCSSRAEIDSSMIHDGGDWRGGVTLLNGLRRVPLESSGRREHEGNSLMPYWSRWHYYQLRWTERSKSLTLTLPRVSSSPTQTEKRWDVNISRKNHPQAISMREWNYSCDQTTCVNKYYFTPGGEIRYILFFNSLYLSISRLVLRPTNHCSNKSLSNFSGKSFVFLALSYYQSLNHHPDWLL